MAKVQKIQAHEFETEVLGSNLPVLVDFTATWCGPCRVLAPIVENVAEELAGRVRVGSIDLDEAPEIAARLRIRGAPTLIVFAQGKEIARHLGLTSREKLLTLVGKAIEAAAPVARGAETARREALRI